ncbi:hypothetical protein [Mycolicibacterium goodii]|uniref:Lipoprotein n=1 Tax=Mycolicibacterium goodii TaxID=134601 RepID=A0ABS6HXI2_MYCGD|nr:hypothetical protein [Mycolicibacterium goodii]MBU8826235.1 hypothetical protein [Mycolicibacterium goodii]MBU8839454.1 hypothetical protein [Mycolicibacterium goodii]
MRICVVRVVLAAGALAGCSSGAVINTGDAPSRTPTPTTTAVPQYGTTNLVNAADYAMTVDGRTGYYFTTPSGRWQCAILPRDRAGCESSNGLSSGLPITGAPEVIVDGEPTAPNAIAVDGEHDAGFLALEDPLFSVDSPTGSQDTVETLPFGKALAVAGFRCNVQEETGVSCVRELSGKGFTFSADGYTLTYTDIP